MNRRRRAGLTSALASGAVALSVLGVGARAVSAHEPEGAVSIVDQDGALLDEPGEGQELSVRGQFRHSNPDAPLVERIELSLAAVELADDCPIPLLAPIEGEEATREFLRPLPPFDCNGTWLLSARATTGDASPIHGAEAGTASTSFGLAVRPVDPVGLEAQATEGDDGSSSAVTLTWLPNRELDLVGYRIERLAPGEEAYEVVGFAGSGPEPSFIDDELGDAGERLYRVSAIRAGVSSAAGDRVASAGSDRVAVDVAAATAATTTSTIGLGATTSSPRGGSGPRPAPAPTGGSLRTPTTRDSGFGGTLPFDPSLTTTSIAPGEQPPPPLPGDSAVMALTEVGSDAGPRRLLLPVAGSLALLVGAAHVHHVVRRASQPDEVITPL